MPAKGSRSSNLTADALRILYADEFLPSIRKEFKTEIAKVEEEISVLTATCIEIKASQTFLSNEYDSLLIPCKQQSRMLLTTLTRKFNDFPKKVQCL